MDVNLFFLEIANIPQIELISPVHKHLSALFSVVEIVCKDFIDQINSRVRCLISPELIKNTCPIWVFDSAKIGKPRETVYNAFVLKNSRGYWALLLEFPINGSEFLSHLNQSK